MRVRACACVCDFIIMRAGGVGLPGSIFASCRFAQKIICKFVRFANCFFGRGGSIIIALRGSGSAGTKAPEKRRKEYCTMSKVFCDCCGNLTAKPSAQKREFFRGELCPDCARQKLEQVYPYHGARFGWMEPTEAQRKTRLYMGAEIEIDGGDEDSEFSRVLHAVSSAPALGHAERDGSLDYGAEYITTPATWEGWQDRRAALDALFAAACEEGYRPGETTTAGLHIHVDRAYIGNNRAYTDLVGLYMYHGVRRLFRMGLKSACRRFCGENEGADMSDVLHYCRITDMAANMYAGETLAESRYFAVNITNEKTIEIRLFAGARNTEDVLFALDFAQALTRWARNAVAAMAEKSMVNCLQSLTFSVLSSYFRDRAAAYRYLSGVGSMAATAFAPVAEEVRG